MHSFWFPLTLLLWYCHTMPSQHHVVIANNLQMICLSVSCLVSLFCKLVLPLGFKSCDQVLVWNHRLRCECVWILHAYMAHLEEAGLLNFYAYECINLIFRPLQTLPFCAEKSHSSEMQGQKQVDLKSSPGQPRAFFFHAALVAYCVQLCSSTNAYVIL